MPRPAASPPDETGGEYGTPETMEPVDAESDEESSGTSWTALIPAMFGLPILLCGVWASVSPPANKLAMHLAATVGLLGALAASAQGMSQMIRWVRADATFNPRAFIFLSLMAILCWMFVIACFASFIKARKAQEASGGKPEPPASAEP